MGDGEEMLPCEVSSCTRGTEPVVWVFGNKAGFAFSETKLGLDAGGLRRRQGGRENGEERETRQAACKMKRRSWRDGGKNVGVYMEEHGHEHGMAGRGRGWGCIRAQLLLVDTSKTHPRHVRGDFYTQRKGCWLAFALHF